MLSLAIDKFQSIMTLYLVIHVHKVCIFDVTIGGDHKMESFWRNSLYEHEIPNVTLFFAM